MKAARHFCDANGCRVEIDARLGVCPAHWKALPSELQQRIYAAGRKFKSRAERLSSVEFLEAWADAVEFIARAEDRQERNVFRNLADAVKRQQLGSFDQAHKDADKWNARVAVGDMIEYRSTPSSHPLQFRTRSAAQVLSNHTAVVWLEGKAGCVATSACVPLQ